MMQNQYNLIVNDIYEASTGEVGWSSLRAKLFDYLGAEAGTLRFREANGQFTNVFRTGEAGEDLYAKYYLEIDPIRSAVSRMTVSDGGSEIVLFHDDVLNPELYHRTEFYQDFVRPNGREHMLIGVVGDDDHTIMSFFRQRRAFSMHERSALAAILPHVRRGLKLRKKMKDTEHNAFLNYSVFEALPGILLALDSSCKVIFANAAARQMFARQDMPFSISSVLCGEGGRVVLKEGDGQRFRQIVYNASCSGRDGAILIEYTGRATEQAHQIAVYASPLRMQAGFPAAALIVIQDLSELRSAPISLLGELFGLTNAECAVAVALLGGQTAEVVAGNRQVSLETVRAQIRTVLHKTDASNLRDFERIGALLSTMARR